MGLVDKEVYEASVENGIHLGTAIYGDIMNFFDKIKKKLGFKDKEEVSQSNHIAKD